MIVLNSYPYLFVDEETYVSDFLNFLGRAAVRRGRRCGKIIVRFNFDTWGTRVHL